MASWLVAKLPGGEMTGYRICGSCYTEYELHNKMNKFLDIQYAAVS